MDALSIALVAVVGVLLAAVVLLVIYVVHLHGLLLAQASRGTAALSKFEVVNNSLIDVKAQVRALQKDQEAAAAANAERLDAVARELAQVAAAQQALPNAPIEVPSTSVKATEMLADASESEAAPAPGADAAPAPEEAGA